MSDANPTTPGTDTPPDRLSNHPKSPFYNEAALERGVGIKFKGEEKTNVAEYCVSESWVRLTIGNKVDRTGAPMTIKVTGEVAPDWRNDKG